MDLGNGVKINFGELDPSLLPVAAAELIDAAQAQGVELPQFAGAGAVGAAMTAEAEPEVESESPAEALTDTFDTLTPEQQERATSLMVVLAEKFGRNESDFSVVKSVNERGEDIFAVALTATEGIDLGDPDKSYDPKRNWDNTTAEDSQFIVEVDGNKIDTRTPIDGELLKAVAAINPEINEWVWRTGEQDKAGGRDAPIAGLYDGQVGLCQYYRGGDGWSGRFRPAVVI